VVIGVIDDLVARVDQPVPRLSLGAYLHLFSGEVMAVPAVESVAVPAVESAVVSVPVEDASTDCNDLDSKSCLFIFELTLK